MLETLALESCLDMLKVIEGEDQVVLGIRKCLEIVAEAGPCLHAK